MPSIALGGASLYDFQPGMSFGDGPGLEDWFASFSQRYPWPTFEGSTLSPETLARIDSGFRVKAQEHFEISVRLVPDFYLGYRMTETNVAAAVRRGKAYADIKAWCAESLSPVWKGVSREILFRGYFACMIENA